MLNYITVKNFCILEIKRIQISYNAFSITIGGKIFSSIIILIGIGIVPIPTGLIASSINKNIKN